MFFGGLGQFMIALLTIFLTMKLILMIWQAHVLKRPLVKLQTFSNEFGTGRIRMLGLLKDTLRSSGDLSNLRLSGNRCQPRNFLLLQLNRKTEQPALTGDTAVSYLEGFVLVL